MQVGRANQISAASGVAYAKTCGAINLLNWTDVGPNVCLRSLGQRHRVRHVSSHRRNVCAALHPATLRLTAEMLESLSALSGIAYEKLGAIFPVLPALTPPPTPMTSEWMAIGAQSGSLQRPIHRHFLQTTWEQFPRSGLMARKAKPGSKCHECGSAA